MKKPKKTAEMIDRTLPPYRLSRSEKKSYEILKKHLGTGICKYFNIS